MEIPKFQFNCLSFALGLLLAAFAFVFPIYFIIGVIGFGVALILLIWKVPRIRGILKIPEPKEHKSSKKRGRPPGSKNKEKVKNEQ